jgi:phage gp36-like protein
MATPYATSTDLANFGLSQAALAGVNPSVITAALQSASDEADGYFRSQFTLPLTNWSTDLTQKVCQIAALIILTQRGFSPDGSDDVYVQAASSARQWFRDVAMGKTVPGVTDSSSGATPGYTTATGPKVFSQRSRGFARRPPRLGGGGFGNGEGGCF